MTHAYKQLAKDFPEAHHKLTLREYKEKDKKIEEELTEYGMGKKHKGDDY